MKCSIVAAESNENEWDNYRVIGEKMGRKKFNLYVKFQTAQCYNTNNAFDPRFLFFLSLAARSLE